MLAGVNLLGRKKDKPPPDDVDVNEVAADSEPDAKDAGGTAASPGTVESASCGAVSAPSSRAAASRCVLFITSPMILSEASYSWATATVAPAWSSTDTSAT